MGKKKFVSFAAMFAAALQALTFVTATGVAEDLPDNDVLFEMYLEKMFYECCL